MLNSCVIYCSIPLWSSHCLYMVLASVHRKSSKLILYIHMVSLDVWLFGHGMYVWRDPPWHKVRFQKFTETRYIREVGAVSWRKEDNSGISRKKEWCLGGFFFCILHTANQSTRRASWILMACFFLFIWGVKCFSILGFCHIVYPFSGQKYSLNIIGVFIIQSMFSMLYCYVWKNNKLARLQVLLVLFRNRLKCTINIVCKQNAFILLAYNRETVLFYPRLCVVREQLRYGRMVKALACQVEGPGFKSHHGKKFRKKKFRLSSKKKKKKKGQLSSACMMEVRMTGVLPNS